MQPTTMTYGGYQFSPVPMLSIVQNLHKTAGGKILGSMFKLTLKGELVNIGGGLGALDAAQDALRAALFVEGLVFLVKCGSTVVLQCNPRILSVDFESSKDNWTDTTPYSVTMEFDASSDNTTAGDFINLTSTDGFNLATGAYITDTNEEWHIEMVDSPAKFTLSYGYSGGSEKSPYQFKVTHRVGATGKRHYNADGSYTEAWLNAKNYVATRLGYDSSKVIQTGILNLAGGSFTPFNYMRVVSQDETGGKYGVDESWIILSTESGVLGSATEEFNVEVKTSLANSDVTVSIQGSIQGLETINYGSASGHFNNTSYGVTTSKFSNASSYWDNAKPRLYYRAVNLANTYITGATPNIALNTGVVNRSIGFNPAKGSISYSYEYNNRPQNNCVAGSLSETYTIADINPTDVFAAIAVLGREAGPVLQDMGTVKEASRRVSVEVVMPRTTGCPTSSGAFQTIYGNNPRSQVYANLISGIYQDLTGTYEQVFKSEDTESWQPKEGRYTRNIAWVYQ